MKYKVGILDDEVLVREAIQLKYPFSERSFDIIIEHDDGKEVLKMFKNCETQPVDALLVDIMMPKLNGLEFIKQVKEIWPEINCVIISGYNEFDFAKKAIQLGVNDYLLKPVNSEELERIMEGIKTNLDAREKEAKEEIQEEITDWLYLKGAMSLSKSASEWLRSRLGDHFELYLILFGNIQGSQKTKGFLSEGLNFPLDSRGHGNLWVHINHSCHFASNLNMHNLGCSITIAHFTKLTDLRALPVCVNRGIELIQQTLNLEENTYNKFSCDYIQNEWKWTAINKENLDLLLKLKMETNKRNALNILKDILKQSMLQKIKEEAVQRFCWDHLQIEVSVDWLQSFDHSNEFCRECLALIEETSEGSIPQTGREILNEVLRDIEKEYYLKRTLKDYAKLYHIHPNHLSRLFKQELNLTYVDFVTNIRMNLAKERLLESSEKASEIAIKVGFEDARYFSQVFRRHFGTTPTEFRERYKVI